MKRLFANGNRKKRILVRLHPLYAKKYGKEHGFVAMGTFGSALSPKGDKLYITWMGNRGGGHRGRMIKETCALTVVHIPEAMRQP